MSYECILYGVEDQIGTITLNRPAVLNAINRKMVEELADALDSADRDPAVRVVVLRGAGRSFSSGADLKEKATGLSKDPEQLIAAWKRGVGYHKIWQLTKPVIAAVHGYCLAGAVTLAGLCDITIASDDAIFGMPQVRFANAPMVPILVLLTGIKKGKELMFTGDNFSAKEAALYGIVNRVVPRAVLEEETYAFARRLLKIPQSGLAMYKRVINRLYEAGGFMVQADTGYELLAYANSLHAIAGDDVGFRQRIREKGLKRALAELKAPLGETE